MRRNKRWSITKISERLGNAEMIEAAEQAAEDALDLAQCAKAWINQFADNLKAKKCIERAMLIADFPGAWVECLDTWLILKNRGEALYCMEKAEETADDCYSFTYCAFYWNKRFGNKKRAANCLRRAEQEADCSEDYRDCAHYWVDLLNEKSKAIICMEKAEKLAESSSDWYECAQIWLRSLYNEINAKRCEKCAESFE